MSIRRKKLPRNSLKTRLLLSLAGMVLLAGLVWAVQPAQKPPLRSPESVHTLGPIPPRQVPAAPPPAFVFPRGRGKIAIVLDDWGYSMKQASTLAAIRQPLTVAILPGLPYSVQVADVARKNGHEVILHLPMEAMDPNASSEKEVIRVGMSPAQVLANLDQALATVPGARGVNNHQGSRATSDLSVMRVVLKDLKRRGYFYLDSYVTNQSVCRQAARENGIRFARRDVFLDNADPPAAIREQLMLLAQTAARRGTAVGIGHDRPGTLKVLREAIPALKKAGFTLVPVSELAEKAD